MDDTRKPCEHTQNLDRIYDIHERLQCTASAMVSMLSLVLETDSMAETGLAMMPLAVDLAFPVEALARAWSLPLPAFMKTAHRLKAAQAALEGQTVGSYLDFCAESIGGTQDTHVTAIRLLYRSKPNDLTWNEFLTERIAPKAMAIEASNMEALRGNATDE